MNTPSPIPSTFPPSPRGPAPRRARRGTSRPPVSHLPSRHALVTRLSSLVSLFLFLFLPAASALAATVEWDIQPRILNLGETATATITFHGPDAPGGLSLPDTDGLSIQNAGVTRQNITGSRSVLVTYRIFPRRAGDFTLGP